MSSVVQNFPNAAVLVVGDVMLDEYLWGEVLRVSPEAPVPVVEFRRRTQVLGGAANAAANVVALGGDALLGGVVGHDAEAAMLRNELTRVRIETFLVASADRPTTLKTRVIAGSQQILRIDREGRKPVLKEIESSLLEWAGGRLSDVDCVLISDYGKGVVTHSLCQALMELARVAGKPVVVDPKGRDYSKYAGAAVVTPNVAEVHLAAEPLSVSPGDLEEDVTRLYSLLPGTAFVVTRGAEGVSLFRSEQPPLHLTTQERNIFDVTGAGDTFVATLALALAASASLEEAARIGNMAAGVVVGKVGTSTVDLNELDPERASD